MSNWRPLRILTFVGIAVVGYLTAFGSAATGLLFAALVAVGIFGELGFWVELFRGWRRGGSTPAA